VPIDLRGKRALITGAAQGIGRSTAILFEQAGAEVLATDLNMQGLRNLDCSHIQQLDVTDAEAVEQLLDVPAFDIIFNCAGLVQNGSIDDCTETEWQTAWDVNVTSMYRIIKTLLPGMIYKGGGSIINVASVASSIIGVPNRFSYGVTKAAVIGLTKSIAADFCKLNVRCNAICPGTIESPSLHERLAATGDFDSALKAFTSRQPMGRLGRADEVAALALYLASDASAFTTGQCHVIDGGWSNM